MRINSVNLPLKSLSERSLAKGVFDLFFHLYSEALKEEISTRCDYNASIAANTAYEREALENGEGVGSWISGHPYSSSNLLYKKNEMDDAAKNLKETKSMMDFIRNRLLDGINYKTTDEEISI